MGCSDSWAPQLHLSLDISVHKGQLTMFPLLTVTLTVRVCICLYVCPAAGDLWLLSADDHSTLLDAVMESFRIHDRAVSSLVA